MIEFLAGAVAFAYLVAGVYFHRFWRITNDRLFIGFAWAFWLLAVNHGLIPQAIVRKNLNSRARSPR